MITIIAPLAGVDMSEIDITVNRNILTISGERKRPALYAESGRILVEECFFGPFSRNYRHHGGQSPDGFCAQTLIPF